MSLIVLRCFWFFLSLFLVGYHFFFFVKILKKWPDEWPDQDQITKTKKVGQTQKSKKSVQPLSKKNSKNLINSYHIHFLKSRFSSFFFTTSFLYFLTWIIEIVHNFLQPTWFLKFFSKLYAYIEHSIQMFWK